MPESKCLVDSHGPADLYTLYCPGHWWLLSVSRRNGVRRWFGDTYGREMLREAMQAEYDSIPRLGIRWARNG